MTRAVLTLFTLGLLLMVPSGAVAGPGDLDLGFGKRGLVVVPSSKANSQAFDIAAGNDGRIVVVGQDGPGALIAGLKRNGTADRGFGESGLAPEVPWKCERCIQPVLSVLRQGSGFLVAGVNRGSGMVARLDADGEIDQSWASGFGFARGFDVVWDIAQTPSGKILLVTSDEVVRLMPTGEIDRSFGRFGRVDLSGLRTGRSRLAANQIDVSKNGSIYVAGSAYRGNRTQQVFVAKLEKSGDFDKSFGPAGSGVIRPRLGYSSDIRARSGGLYVSATLMSPRGRPDSHRAAILKFSLDGERNKAFGRGGIVKSRSDRSHSTAMIVTRRHVIVGTGLIAARKGGKPPHRVSRLDHGGRLDRSFGQNGRVKVRGIFGRGMTLDGEGRVLIAGYRGTLNRPTAVVARLKGD